MAQRVSTLIPLDELRYEPSPRWVRAELGGETVADSHDPWLYWLPGRPVPGYCFPREDVRLDLLHPVEPRMPGVAEAFDVRAGGRVAGAAAWIFADPQLEGRIALDYYTLDRWLEEEEEIVGHPRDPFKRVDVRQSSRHVRVSIEGRCVAESRRPLLLFETGLPVRYYLPRGDVRGDLLAPSETHTLCAYKGRASYYAVAGVEDVAWFYPDPLPDMPALLGHVAFFNERVDIEVDGELQERPVSPWS